MILTHVQKERSSKNTPTNRPMIFIHVPADRTRTGGVPGQILPRHRQRRQHPPITNIPSNRGVYTVH
jgi:hypothetical protein